MRSVTVNVGLDYHEYSVQACVMDEHGRVLANRGRPNDVEAVAEFVLNHGFPRGLAIEACCGAAAFAHELRRHYGWTVRLAHPGYVQRLKQSPDKSDHDDATLNASSGRREADGGLVRQGNSELRRIVIEAAHRLARKEQRWKELKNRLIAKGKPRSVATAAVANRWIRWLYHQIVNPPPQQAA